MKATTQELKMIAEYKSSDGVVKANGIHWSDDETVDFAKQYHAKQLLLDNVSGSFTANDVERAYNDGYSTEGEVTFDINNYVKRN